MNRPVAMSNSELRYLLVANAVIIAAYAIAAGMGSDGVPSLTVAVVAAMAGQIVLVLRPPRRTSTRKCTVSRD